MEDKMPKKKEKGNRVVVTDAKDEVKRIRTDKEIIEENDELEKSLKGKKKTQKQNLQDVLKEKKEMRKKQKTEEKEMTVMLVGQQDRSVNVGVVGVGQCGSKIAEELYERGYNTVVINTALQDLKHIRVPERHKLFLDYSLGGAAKDLDTGKAAVEQYENEVLKHVEDNTEDCEVLLLAVSGGGGTGSGSAETMVSIMSQLGKPLSVLFVLPMASEDALAKHNAIQTLARLAKLAKDDVVNSLIVVDNAKIELMFPGKSMAEFWKVANQSIVEPLHLFNKLSANPSEYTSLDPMDFSRLFIGTGDCALYGMIEVEDYLEDEAIAEAMVTNLESGLLSSDFDLGQTRSAGVIITGSKEALSKVPATNIEYGFAMIGKICNEGTRVFRGVYEVPSRDDVLRIYSFFSGLGLPEERVSELKAEAERHMDALKGKEDSRATAMNIDVGKTKTTSAVDELHKRIKNKNSAMGKLKRNTRRVIDRRRT
jgi:cell division GTPase FtsZ